MPPHLFGPPADDRRPDRALALPAVRDPRDAGGRIQVGGGFALAIVYALVALRVAGAYADSFDVLPGILAVLAPPWCSPASSG